MAVDTKNGLNPSGSVSGIITNNDIIDSILNSYKYALKNNLEAYQNHVYRVFNLALPYVKPGKDHETLSIAAAFHDLGIWTHNTFDYLGPSVELATQYSLARNLDAATESDITSIIKEHHKLTKTKTSRLAEIFRQADLADLSLGLIRHGMDKRQLQLIRRTFPNKGFYYHLLKLFIKNLFKNPLKPLPMYKW